MLRYFPVAVLYPAVYWMLMAVITAVSTPKWLLRVATSRGPAWWRTAREAA